MASIQDTLKQINRTLKASTSGPYPNYSCKKVSWDDVQRGTVGDGLSCWGANITDTRMYAKDRRQLFTVRGDNWNERLGKVTTEDVAVVASDDGGGGTTLRPFTLRSILTDPSRFGRYAGLIVYDLSDYVLDKEVSIRFQTTFIPVGAADRSTLDFAPEAYNYNTRSDDDPRNIIMLCTTQGVAIQQDGVGGKKLLHHAKIGDEVHRYWLEVESSDHKVGGSQVESSQEREDALKRGKATSSVIGIKSMGTRFNALMTIQIPLKQKISETPRTDSLSTALCIGDLSNRSSLISQQSSRKRRRKNPIMRIVPSLLLGRSSAGRVSRGSHVDVWNGLTMRAPRRHPTEHITITVVFYYTCSGGVPKQSDVRAAIDELEEMYRSVEGGRLADGTFDFMKSDLTAKDMTDIETNIITQPPLA